MSPVEKSVLIHRYVYVCIDYTWRGNNVSPVIFNLISKYTYSPSGESLCIALKNFPTIIMRIMFLSLRTVMQFEQILSNLSKYHMYSFPLTGYNLNLIEGYYIIFIYMYTCMYS